MNPKQRELLTKLGKEPISLPADINHGGDVRLQQMHCTTEECPAGACRCGLGMHHRPEYQKTGTYNHPNLVRQRLREAEDALERARTMRMSDTERSKLGIKGGGLKPLEDLVAQRKKDWVTYVGAGMLKELQGMIGSEDLMERAMSMSVRPEISESFLPPVPKETPKEVKEVKEEILIPDVPAEVEAPAPVIKKKGRPAKKVEEPKDAIERDAEETVSAEDLARAAGASKLAKPMGDFKSDK